MTKQLLLVLLAAVAVARGYEPEKESQREMARPSAQHHFTLGVSEGVQSSLLSSSAVLN